MAKSIHRPEYRVLLKSLREQRVQAGLTQAECSLAIGRPQSFMSDIERGGRRLDIVQLFDLCDVLNMDIGNLIELVRASRTANKKKRKGA